MSSDIQLRPLRIAAQALRVPPKWLHAEIDAGRIPALDAGGKYLLDVEHVRALLVQRARDAAANERAMRTPPRQVRPRASDAPKAARSNAVARDGAGLEAPLALPRSQAAQLAELSAGYALPRRGGS
jgi:hypothetical protein